MGVGGNFWEVLKPYGKMEGYDCLREKRVAVDLSYWIVQNQTAVSNIKNPHLTLFFFRTINLFSKFGALPVFVADGTPSPLKSQARIKRFFQASGIDLSNLPVAEDGASMERNPTFQKCVRECVELLELLGMPVLKANGEAEALCAQLNNEGQVDACITSDSDAFIFGAKCVIKHIRPNSKEPFECYYMSDIESGLGVKRNHLIAISLLVGNDHDLKGVQGIGIDTALRFVKSFSEDEVLTRLTEIGKGERLQFGLRFEVDHSPICYENSTKKKSPHCSVCGHPGSKIAHLSLTCEYCISSTSNGCNLKPVGFKCDCTSCVSDRRDKEKTKGEMWQIKICQKISMEHNFPNAEIIKMYLNNDSFKLSDEIPRLAWESPKVEMLIDFMGYYQNWEPSYIRQRILPMLSTTFLREVASGRKEDLLYGQYVFDSIHRLKTRFGHQLLVVNWKKYTPASDNIVYTVSDSDDELESPHESNEQMEFADTFDGVEASQSCFRDGCWFLTTDENMDLVKAAFPEKFDKFFREKELKDMKSKRKKSVVTTQSSEASPSSKSMQLSITEFYRASKTVCKSNSKENLTDNLEHATDSSEGKRKSLSSLNLTQEDFTNNLGHSADSSEGKRKNSSSKLSKSVRRRLLFG